MFAKSGTHPTGCKLSAHLETLPIDRLQGTWISGDPTRSGTPIEITTNKWSVLRCFVERKTGTGLWFVEYWEHDNGYRADFQQVSLTEAKYLLRNAQA